MNMHQNFGGAPAGVVAPPPRRRRHLRTALIAGVIALVALVVALMMRGGKDDDAAALATPSSDLPRISVVVPGRSSVTAMVAATGSLSAVRDMPVGVAGEGGMIERVLVDAGDYVRAGQVLARIDRSVQEEQARQLSAQIEASRADAELAGSELERAEALVGRGFISKADIQRRVATRDAARARVDLARAQLAEMRARIARLDIRAPTAGLVLERNVEAGQVVSSGGPALFRMAEGGAVELRAQVAEQDLGRLKVGLPARVTPVDGSASVDGRVWLVSPTVDPQTRQGIVRIRVPATRGIRPGGFASVRISAGGADQPVLPESAILNDTRGNFVYVVGPDNKVARRDVTVGQVSEKGVAVATGLAGDEQVVLSAGAFLNPGETVVPDRVKL